MASIKEIFRKERASVEKAKEYYTKASSITFDPTWAAIENFKLGFIHISLGEQKRGEEFWAKAFRDDKVFTFVKSEDEKGNRVLLIYHTASAVKVKK